MGFLVELLGNVLTGLTATAIVNLPGLVIQLLKGRAVGMNPDEVKAVLDSLGATSPDCIRQLVNQELGRDRRVTAPQKEDVAAVLISLSRGATALNSQGGLTSLYVRSEELLRRLLDSVRPRRQAGEPAFPNDTWVLERFLGMGAFGEVWLVYNPHTRDRRAYKFFTHDKAADWLRGETQRLLGVRDKLKDHPQIVRLFDVGTPSHGHPFLALEHVAGGSLEDWISDGRRGDRPLRKAEVMRGIVRAVAAAHREQIYHCDLKPANILLTPGPDVQPKITDFGLSSVGLPEDAGPADLGAALAGTPMYLPPEALRPFADRKPAQYDVFALGVIWYQLLAEKLERPPYDFASELRESGADSHTINLLSRCLAHPARRFPDAAQLADEMDTFDLPAWSPVPEGLYDVQGLVREFVARSVE